jgi:sulfate transport system ATP-binding protein
MGSTDELYERPATPFVFDFLGDTNVLPAEVRGRSVYLPGADRPAASDGIHPAGPVDVYVRPGDLRLADAGDPGVDVRIRGVQRSGPTVRASVETVTGAIALQVELPHLHHDVPRFVEGVEVRLRFMQYSVYPRGAHAGEVAVAAPVLIGRERERGRLGG